MLVSVEASLPDVVLRLKIFVEVGNSIVNPHALALVHITNSNVHKYFTYVFIFVLFVMMFVFIIL